MHFQPNRESNQYRIFTAVCAAALALLAGSASADTLYGVNFSSTTTNLYSISDTTGVATNLGVLIGITQATGAEWDIAAQRLIVATGNNTNLGSLYSVDPSTRAVTLQSQVRIGSTASGTLQEGGFAIDPTTGKRYGVIPALNYTYLVGSDGTYAPIDSLFDTVQAVDPSGLTIACEGTAYALMYDQKEVDPAQVYKVDLETGKATQLPQSTGQFPASGTVGSITHRASGGTLWMTEGTRLFTVDSNTGAANLVGGHGLPAGVRISGLAWSNVECTPCPNPTNLTRMCGIPDNFVLPLEPVAPAPDLAAFLGRNNGNNVAYHNGVNRRHDETGSNWEFGHTFDTLPAGTFAGTLTFRLKGDSGSMGNDGLGVGYKVTSGVPAQRWGSLIKNLSLLPGGSPIGSWGPNNPQTFTLDLKKLPLSGGGTKDLLPVINSTGRLDFYMQDDTSIDFIQLDLRTCGCIPRNRLYRRGDMDNFAAQTAGDSTVNRARTAVKNWLAVPGGNNATYHAGVPLPFDQVNPINWNFGVTFNTLPAQIQRATLEMRLRASPGATNDSVWLQFNSGSAGSLSVEWASGIPSITGLPWTSGQTATITLDLATLPALGGGTILDTMNQRGYLDVMLADDTAVDYIKLDIDACGHPHFRGALVTTSGVATFSDFNGARVYNFGSSGDDSVAFSFEPSTSALITMPPLVDPCLTFNPPPSCFGQGKDWNLIFRIGGLVAPAPEPGENPDTAPRLPTYDTAIGSIRINTMVPSCLRAYGDFSPIGVATCSVQVLNGGVVVGSAINIGSTGSDGVMFEGYPSGFYGHCAQKMERNSVALTFDSARPIMLPGPGGATVMGDEIVFIDPTVRNPYDPPCAITSITISSDMDSVGPGGVQLEFTDLELEPLPEPPACCPGDANGDGTVNFNDAAIILANFGTTYPPGTQNAGDANCDGIVSFSDMADLLANFGTSCN